MKQLVEDIIEFLNNSGNKESNFVDLLHILIILFSLLINIQFLY